MKVSGARLARDLAAVNAFGATAAGGAERLAWGEADLAARRWLADACREIGLTVEADEAGNVWAHGREPRGIYLGSHLDTVPDGGRFDGALGVVGALEVVRAAREARHPMAERLGLVCFTDEEGARFGIGMLGSRSVAGEMTVEEIERGVDHAGARLPDVLRASGFDPAHVPLAARRRERMAAYLELHVEQGLELERRGLAVGVVTGIVGTSNWRIEVTGVADHAGGTMPEDRRDALVPVAQFALVAQRAMRSHPRDLVATVGEATVVGGASNIIPGKARCTLDIRSLEEPLLRESVEELIDGLRRSAADNCCTLALEETKRMAPARMDPRAIAASEEAAAAEGIPVIRLPSKAAHDGMGLANAGVPVGMVFVRSVGGISHAPDESSTEADCEAGARVIARTAVALAEQIS